MRRLTFEDTSQTFTISSLTKRSVEDTKISLQVGPHTFSYPPTNITITVER